ncbi:Right handed beta helix region [Mariniphaga anaerophila]|uniref:Right handed beta helix region n=1 Tax=Mariniphaga anaerophila TaxID=1484053 RepID=A0A1M5E370_9BACT|nr:CotH kinase family protein [Mariniphaga anaerophila]SHF73673.1 Right handed beta helix region [Mariniphaga anaerophila]
MIVTDKNIIALIISVIVVFGCTPGNNTKEDDFENIFKCSAEKLDNSGKKFVDEKNQSMEFGNVETRTSEQAYSGEYASKLTPQTPYGFTTDFTAGADEYFKVTAWRKSNDDNGVIVIDCGEGYYHAGKFVVEERKDGWQKIYLEAYTPPHFLFGKVRIFVWNNSQDTVYFDDLEIVHRQHKDYPEYDRFSALSIYVEDNNLNYFNKKRIEAFDNGVLVNEDEDYAGAVIFDGNDFLNGEVRLKGDLMDHIQGDKWSFRIKLKSDFAWNHVRTFSVHDPATRNFLHEWLAHQIFTREDVLTTRYGFVPVVLNNRSRGIYAWEEHFEKHLIENRDRREGPIVRFDETLFWNRVMEANTTKKAWDVDYFGAAKITPFKEGSVTSDSLKTRQAEEAQKLMLQYKTCSMPVSEIFDVDVLARYYALMDITQAYHGFTWHNQRFYFNPVTCLLEPIAFDGYIEGGIFKRIDEPMISLLDPAKLNTFHKEELMLYQVFTDSSFNRKYLENLKAYSDPLYVENVVRQYTHQADSLSGLIRQEFPYYHFNFDFIRSQARLVRENLSNIENNVQRLNSAFRQINYEKFRNQYTTEVGSNITPWLVQAFYNKGNRTMDVLNYHGGEVSVVGVLVADNLPESFSPNVKLPAYDGVNPGKATISVQGEPNKILFNAGGKMLESDVSHWAFSDEISSRQRLMNSANEAKLTESSDSIIFDGKYVFNSDVYIPANKKVVFLPGTQIDLVNGAGFFSFSAFYSMGEEKRTVEFFSSDKSSQGVHVLQASERSILKHTRFYRLGSIRKGGWQTPSAVTFYEADVDFSYCTFEANVDCDDALNVVRSDFFAKNCRFIDTFADAFDSDFCTGRVLDCEFVNMGNDAIDFSGSRVFISGCTMFEISDKAISGGENSQLTVKNCKVNKATIGVAAKDLSSVEIEGSEIRKTVYAFVAFKKKPEYGSASISAENVRLKGNLTFHKIEEGSLLKVNGTEIFGREKKLALKLYQ